MSEHELAVGEIMGYATIRDAIGELIGKRLVEVTQHDEEFFRESNVGFIDLMFDSGVVGRLGMPDAHRLSVVNPCSPSY